MLNKLNTLYIFYCSMIPFNSNAAYFNIIKSSNNFIIVSINIIMHNVIITTKILPKIPKD